jgi:hypothetical protein
MKFSVSFQKIRKELLYCLLLVVLLATNATASSFTFPSNDLLVRDTAVVSGQPVAVGYNAGLTTPYRYNEVGGVVIATPLGIPAGASSAIATNISSSGVITGTATFAGGRTQYVQWNNAGVPTLVNYVSGYTNQVSTGGSPVVGGYMYGTQGSAVVQAAAGSSSATALPLPPGAPNMAVNDAASYGGTTVVVGVSQLATSFSGAILRDSGSGFTGSLLGCGGTDCNLFAVDDYAMFAGGQIGGQAMYLNLADDSITRLTDGGGNYIDGYVSAILMTGSGPMFGLNGYDVVNDVGLAYLCPPGQACDTFANVWSILNPGIPLGTTPTEVWRMREYGGSFVFAGNGSPVWGTSLNPYGNPTADPSEVAEPGSLLLLATGLGGIWFGRRRNSKARV